jgi:speckle-type POZ protein
MGNINSCWAEPPAAETSSSCITKTATAAHNFTVTNYSLLKGMGMGKFVSSRPFRVGGYSWQIRFCPDGADQEHAGYAAAFLCRCDGAAATTGVQTKYTLSLRHTDGKVHGDSKYSSKLVTHTFQKVGAGWGFSDFIEKSKLQEDCFTIRCDLTVIGKTIIV